MSTWRPLVLFSVLISCITRSSIFEEKGTRPETSVDRSHELSSSRRRKCLPYNCARRMIDAAVAMMEEGKYEHVRTTKRSYMPRSQLQDEVVVYSSPNARSSSTSDACNSGITPLLRISAVAEPCYRAEELGEASTTRVTSSRETRPLWH